MGFNDYPGDVPVARPRTKAARKLQRLQPARSGLQPVVIPERAVLANTWWGKAWLMNLERNADYADRLARGRSYVRKHSVLDLQLKAGHISALVQGSHTTPYSVLIGINPLHSSRWYRIRTICANRFNASELLTGAFPKSIKNLFSDPTAGLFPAPCELRLECSCPDSVSFCNHIAAALVGVGDRLDDDATWFFTLCGIPIDDLITQTTAETTQTPVGSTNGNTNGNTNGRGKGSTNGRGKGKDKPQRTQILDDLDLSDVFGIELATVSTRPTAAPTATMLNALLEAAGNTHNGVSIDQLQKRLGWTKTHIRNTIQQASRRGLLITVRRGRYRQAV